MDVDQASAWRSSWVTQSGPQGLEQRHAADVLAEVEDDLARLVDNQGRAMHQFLQHGTYPAPLGRVADRAQLAGHAQLPHQPQDIVGQLSEMQDQGVGGELARGQPFQVEIGLDLAVELLVGGMRLVARYHRLRRLLQAGPPAFQLIVRFEQQLAIVIGGALHQTHHALDHVFDLSIADRDGLGPQLLPVVLGYSQPGRQSKYSFLIFYYSMVRTVS